jgi:hypothetical protein
MSEESARHTHKQVTACLQNEVMEMIPKINKSYLLSIAYGSSNEEKFFGRGPAS